MTAWILLEHGGDEGIAVELKPLLASPISFGDEGEEFRFRLEPEHDAEDDLHRSAQQSGEHAYQLLLKERKLNWTASARFSLPETQAKTNVHGRSADLLFALTVLKGCMDEVARRIGETASDFPSFAATGVLVEMNGVARVQRVDGIQAKLRAALKVLPEGSWFFYPADNQKDVGPELKQQAAHLHLYPVERLADAAQQLGIAIEGIYLDDPYPGLKPIDYKQRSIFFGREAETKELCDRLLKLEAEKRSGLLVRAASGRGKSSLIRAGVIPALELLRLKQDSPLHERPIIWSAWYPRETGKKPDEEKLVQSIINNWSQAEHAHQLAVLAGQNLSNLAELAEALAQHMPEKSRFFWLIDQCEEIFTSNFDDALIHKFAGFLQQLQIQGVWVVVTLSSSFNRAYELYLEKIFPENQEKFTSSVYPLGQLRQEALEDVIRKPAKNAGAGFEPGDKPGSSLDKQLLQEALAGGTESLPLLAFTLTELWAKRDKDNGQMTYGAYKVISGSLDDNWLDDKPLYKVIGKQADALYESLKPDNDHALQCLLRALTRSVREGLEYAIVEQSALITKFSSKFEHRLIRRFSKKRLLVCDGDNVRVSHMALLTHWAKAQKIIEGIESDLRLREKLIGDAQVWEQQQRNASRLLQVGLPLSEGEYLLKQWPEDLDEYPSVVDFVEASSEAERVWQENARIKRQRLVRIAVAVAVVFAGLSGIAGWQWYVAKEQTNKAVKQENIANAETKKAEQQKQVADNERDNALFKQSLFLADLSRQETDAGRATNGVLLALEALPKNMKNPDRPYVIEAEAALYTALANYHKFTDFIGHTDVINDAVFSRDGKFIASASSDKTARIWDANTGKSLLVLRGHTDKVNAINFSPDGKTIITASSDGTARLWDSAGGKQINILNVGKALNSIKFNTNGTLVLISNGWENGSFFDTYDNDLSSINYGLATVWEIATNKTIFSLQDVGIPRLDTRDKYVAINVGIPRFDPSGKYVAILDEQLVSIWDVDTNKKLFVLEKEGDKIIKFSSDGKFIAIAAREWGINHGEIIILNLVTAKQVAKLEEKSQYVDWIDMEFSPDNNHILAVARSGDEIVNTSEHTVFSWDIKENYRTQINHNKAILAKFSPVTDGDIAVAGHSIITEYTTNRIDISNYKKSEWDIKNITYSPNGKLLLIKLEEGLISLSSDSVLSVPKDSVNINNFSSTNIDKYKEIVDKFENKFIATDPLVERIPGSVSNFSICAITTNGKKALACVHKGVSNLIDLKTGKTLGILTEAGGFPPHTYSYINNAMFSSDNKYLITRGSLDKIWHAFQSTQDLIDFARQNVAPRELTQEQRKQFFLDY